MELRLVEEVGILFVEGEPGQPFLTHPDDFRQIVEGCAWAGADAVLLYPENLTPAFFDLSSGEAGAILLKLQIYTVRLAVVCPPGSVKLSRMFGDMLAEERQGRTFGVFETRAAALEWLGAHR